MAIQFGAKALIQEIGKVGFGVVTGTGITLLGLLAWTGAEDLETIKDSVNQFEQMAEQQVSYLVGEYEVTVDEANAEIGEYKVALEQANGNITKLITAYESKQKELEELQTQLAENYVSVSEVNEVITKANEQIDQANQEVANTKDEVQGFIDGSDIANVSVEERLAETGKELDITEDKTVTDISSIVPQE